MANLNSGTPRRFINGGTLLWGTATGSLDTVLNVVEGSLVVTDPGRGAIPYMNGSELSGAAIEGDQRFMTVTFDIRLTVAGLTGASEVLKLLRPAFASGLVTTKIMRIRIPAARGGSTGDQLTLEKCYLNEGYELTTAGNGGEIDRLRCQFINLQSQVDWVLY